MKKLLLFALFFCLIQSLYSQKVDLDKRDVNIEQVVLPQNNALVKFYTYNVSLFFYPSDKDALGFSDDYLKNQLNLEGYKYVKDKGDFNLNISIDKIKLLSDEVVESTKDVKNSAGQMVKTTTYTGHLKYSAHTSIKLIDNSTQGVIEEFHFSSDKDPIVLTTLVQTSRSEAEKVNAYNKKNTTELTTKYRELFGGHMNKIKSKYGFSIVSESERFWQVDVKKAPELAEFNQHLDNVLKVLGGLKAGDDLENARKQVAADLTYFAENGKKVIASDKPLKKLKYAYYLNLAKAQYYLEMLDQCQENAKVIIDNDYDARDGKEIQAKAIAIKERLNTAGVNSWHSNRHNVNPKIYYSLSDNGNMNQLILDENNKKAYATPVGYLEFPGELITVDNIRHSGKLISKKNFSDNNIFAKTNGATFIYTENGIVKRMSINPDSISSMDFGPDLTFSVFKFDNNQDLPAKRLIFKNLEHNRKIQYLQYFNSNLDLGNDLKISKNLVAMEDVLRHRESGKMAAVGGWTNNAYRERTANFYAQFCPEMKDMILNNVFGNQKTLREWHSQVAGYYLEKCK